MYIIQGKLFKFEKCFFLLTVVVGLASSSPPDNPCPQLFQYKFVENEWIGVIQLDNIKVGQTVSIVVRLALPTLLPSTRIGRLELLEGRQQAVQSVFQGRPLLYKIIFPIQNPLPKLIQIVIDNAVVCSGPPDPSPQMSTIQLYHTFYTKTYGPGTAPNKSKEPSYDLFNNYNNFQYPGISSDPPQENSYLVSSPTNFQTINSQSIFPTRKQQTPSQSVFDYPIQIPEISNMPNFLIGGPQTSKEPNYFFQLPQTPKQPEFQLPEAQKLPEFQLPQTPKQPDYLFQLPQTPKQPEFEIPQNPKQPETPNRVVPQQYPRQPDEPPFIATPKPAQSEVACGVPQVSQITQFVIKGDPTKKGEWPWLAAIFINNGPVRTFQCGGTLLTSKVTVTASHCFFREGQREPMSPSEVFTALGRYNINNWADAGSEFLPSERIEFPPNFIKADSFEMDIAVIIHRRPVSFTEYPLIRPVCLWSGSSNPLEIEGRMGTVVGWGEDELGNKPSPEPKKVQVGIVSRKTCVRGSTQLESVTAGTNFCAGERDGRGPCSGDSGSGLVIFNNDHWELRGIVAGTVQGGITKTNQLCKLDEYVVYVDIFAFKDWILKMMAI